jgi:hypothetical protein
MQYGFEAASLRRIDEYPLAHATTIEFTIRRQHRAAKCGCDFREGGLTALHEIARYDVSIEHGRTTHPERFSNCALARSDTARERD